jgi:hypothetical protein
MKITKSKLKQIIKEELSTQVNEEWYNDGTEYTPEQQKVADAMGSLIELIYNMEHSNPEMTDLYIQMLRALQQAGVRISALASMV